jgi:putative transcriptional regulator
MRKTKSPILEVVHDIAKGLHKAGVMDQITLREFDRLCLPPVKPLQPEQIRNICAHARAVRQSDERIGNRPSPAKKPFRPRSSRRQE